MRINHNISAINTNRLLAGNNSATSKNLEKLSSGLAVNRAGDNAAGLAISEKMRGQIRGLNQASNNASDGISLIQTAEGGLNETHSILQRMRELAVQAATDTNTDDDRVEIQKEVDQLTKEITRISDDTEFNTMKLLDGSLAAVLKEGSTPDYGTTGATKVEVAAGANLTVSGEYTIEVSNFVAGTNHPESNIAATVDTQGTLNTYASAAKTITFDGTKWNDGTTDYADASALKTATGIDVTGTPQNGDKIEVSKYTAGVAASNTTVGGTCSVGELQGKTWTYNGSKWVNGTTEKDASDFTGLTIGGTAKDGTSFTLKADGTLDGTVSQTAEVPATNAAITVTKAPAVTNGTDSKYDLTITGPNSEKVSASAFNLEGITADGTIKLEIDASDALTFHIGANENQNTRITVQDMDATALGVANVQLTTQAGANSAITTIDKAINTVSAQRAALGAMQNRLEHTINNLGTSSENLSAAESQIRDVDMAEEMSAYTKNNILVQAATSMLAQANQQPQSVLSLLQG